MVLICFIIFLEYACGKGVGRFLADVSELGGPSSGPTHPLDLNFFSEPALLVRKFTKNEGLKHHWITFWYSLICFIIFLEYACGKGVGRFLADVSELGGPSSGPTHPLDLNFFSEPALFLYKFQDNIQVTVM